MNGVLTTEEVAQMLRVTRRTVTTWLQQGKLAGIKLGEGRGAEWRIRQQDLDAFIVAHLRGAGGPGATR